MSRFSLQTFLFLALLRVISLFLHFFGPSPNGGRLVLHPDRMLPDAIAIELGLMALITAFFVVFYRLYRIQQKSPNKRSPWIEAGLVLSLAAYNVFGQLDLEVVRWLGQHISITYINTYFGFRDSHMIQRIFSSDLPYTSLALFQILLSLILAVFLWIKRAHFVGQLSTKKEISFYVVTILLITAHLWFRPSEKRWRRVQPALWSISASTWRAITGADAPKNPVRAEADLRSLVLTGRLDSTIADPIDPNYPLYQNNSLGELTPSEFQALPRDQRPNVVLIVFETMRGWQTGMHPDSQITSDTPLVDEIIQEHAQYYPFTHSNGFPSVEGCMAMHLGIWPHFRKTIFSEYLHIQTQSFPEILRLLGYQSFALLGADPSFSNFTPWFQRWYDDLEYDPARHHDGPIIERFIERYDAETSTDQPTLALVWTATTHPPYNVPEEAGVIIADTTEERFRQAMRYADTHVARLLSYLKNRDDWDNTIVILLGDHAQPTTWQWQHINEIGELNPGHTWTGMAILGGWTGVPEPERRDETVSHIDLAPTLISMLNVDIPNSFVGQDLNGPNFTSRPAWAFRYETIAQAESSGRTIFSIRGDHVTRFLTDPFDEVSYGLLEGFHAEQHFDATELERYQDLFRAYGRLLDQNRLMP